MDATQLSYKDRMWTELNSASCPMVGFDMSDEPLSSATKELA
jgi:hypothetical protein